MNIKEKIMAGHTWEDHVLVDDDELKDRLRFGKYDGSSYGGRTAIVSRFESEKIAYNAIKKGLAAKQGEIEKWLKEGCCKNLTLRIRFLQVIGHSFVKSTDWNTSYPATEMLVILEADVHYRDFIIKTAYPTPARIVQDKIRADQKAFRDARAQRIPR